MSLLGRPFHAIFHKVRRTRRVSKPSEQAARQRLHLESLECRSLPSTTWTGLSANPHTDNWSDARNWTNGVPGAADTAIFTSTSGSHLAQVDHAFTVATLTVDANWGGTISVENTLSITNGLNLASGTLGGGGAMTIGGASQWTGGAISIGFRDQVTNTGTLTLANPLSSLVTLNGDGTFVNSGTIIQAGANDLNMQSSGIANLTTLVNQGTYDFRTDTNISSNSGGGTFVNQGILSKSAGRADSSSAITVLLNSSNEIDVSAGNLRLQSNGGTLTGGTFNLTAGTLNLTGGTNLTYAGSFTGSGAGSVVLSGGDLSIGVAGANFNFPAALFQWSGGTISVPFQGQPLINSGTITLSNPSGTLATLTGDGTLLNTGTIEQAGASDLNMQSSGIANITTLLNQGTYDFRTDTSVSSNSGGGTFINQGVVSKSAGRADSFSAISVILNSSSEIDVSAGNLNLQSNGGSLTGGTFNVAAGNLDLTGGQNVTYTGAFTGSGAGSVLLSRGDLIIGVAGATFNFPAPLFQWTGGTISVPYQGELTNTDTITLNNSATTLVNLNGDGTLVNAGTIIQAGANDLNMQSSGIGNLTTLLNQGLYSFQNDSGISSNSGGGTVNNQGSLSKDAGSVLSSSTISVILLSNNEIDVNAGNLRLQSNGGSLTGGTFNVNAGTLDLTGGQGVTYTGTYTGSGAGNVVLSSGTLFVGSAGATFNFQTGLFQWTGGAISVPFQGQPLINMGDITLANTGLVTLRDDGTFVNAGTMEQTGPGDLNMQSFGIGNLTTFVNVAGAVYDMQADSGISSNSGGGTMINQGTLRKSSGTNTSTVSVVFDNTDTPNNPNSDLILVLSGMLSFTGSFTQTAGSINLAGGMVGGGNLNINAGSLTGSGEVFANIVNSGLVSPGGDGVVSTLHIHGNYTQTASGALNIDLSASGFDQLVIDGIATLAGALNVNLVGGFMPNHGQSFGIMTFGSLGGMSDFGSVSAGFTDSFGADGQSLNLVAL